MQTVGEKKEELTGNLISETNDAIKSLKKLHKAVEELQLNNLFDLIRQNRDFPDYEVIKEWNVVVDQMKKSIDREIGKLLAIQEATDIILKSLRPKGG